MIVLPSFKGIVNPQLAVPDGFEAVAWLGKTGVTEGANSTLTKTGGTGGAWDAGAYSSQQAASGKIAVKMKIDVLTKIDMIGISSVSDSDDDASYANIDYAFFAFNGSGYYCENSSLDVIDTLQIGDWVGVRVSSIGRIEYFRIRAGVETVLLTRTSPTLSYPLCADCSLEKASSTILEPRIKIG